MKFSNEIVDSGTGILMINKTKPTVCNQILILVYVFIVLAPSGISDTDTWNTFTVL